MTMWCLALLAMALIWRVRTILSPKNLVVLMTRSAWSPVWVAGIKVNKAKNTHLHGNVVAGSERLGFHIQGHRCSSPESLWSDNVAHSSLHGLHLYKSGLVNCTGISGFLAFRTLTMVPCSKWREQHGNREPHSGRQYCWPFHSSLCVFCSTVLYQKSGCA